MPRRQRIHEEFDSYRRAAIDAGAPVPQVDELKRAFYGGAWALFTLVMKSLTDGPDSSPEDEQFLRDIDAELREYGRKHRARV